MSAPKLFISYSWSSPDYESRVIRLATDLRESGVDVILDKWDLKQGHDAHFFMESMVDDPQIKKVALLCDRVYAEKANSRTGGAGIEAQIISPEIYREQSQGKFVAVIMERDDEGRPYVPTYYSSRIYIDLSEESAFADNFESLLRWVYDKPANKKPEIGKTPSFLLQETERPILATYSRHRRALNAIKGNDRNAIPSVIEYFETLSGELEKLRIVNKEGEYDDAVIASIESFIPHRNEAIEIFLALALYCDTPAAYAATHRFFESLIPYLDCSNNSTQYSDWDFDNFKFIAHELFLYAVACLVRHERFEFTDFLLSTDYYAPSKSRNGGECVVSFLEFWQHVKSLERRNERLSLGRLSIHSDLLEDRSKGLGIEHRHLMQADFILFLRGCLDGGGAYRNWWPETLLRANRSGEFEVFARARSTAYFEKFKVVLGIQDKADLQKLFTEFNEGTGRLPRWQFETIDPIRLSGISKIATKS